MNLIWEDRACEELRDISGYLFDFSSALADEWTDEIAKKVDLLLQFPEMGRIVPEFQLSFVREVFVKKFRLIYTYQNSTICVVAIRSMGQPLGKR